MRLAILLVGLLALAACSSGGGSSGAAKLPLGTERTVAYSVPASGSVAAIDTTLGIAALAVRQGTQAELAAGGLQVEAKDKNATPYYVDVRYTNKGTEPFDPGGLSVGMEDTSGNSLPTVLITSLSDQPYTKCKDVKMGTQLKVGASIESCTLFLAPPGTKLDRVRFTSKGSGKSMIVFTDWAVT